MIRHRLRLIAFSAALLHAAAVLIGLGHQHHHDAPPAGQAVAQSACDHHHHGHCAHDESSQPQSPVPPHDHDDCAACRHLAQPLWHVVVEVEVSAGPLFSPVITQGTLSADPAPRICYLSRGPPGWLA